MSDALESNVEERSYDRTPYDSHPHFQTQPARLAAAAMLFGLDPPDVRVARVLELGCAAGGNCIPLGVRYPDSYVLGVDVSGVQIAQGKARLAEIDVPNVELRKASITEISEADGLFDYIICHGVYSWVPRTVREAILRVCRERLSPAGVAYVSYNALPGWHLKRVVRDMMLYHARGIDDPRTRVDAGRQLVADVAVGAKNAFGELMRGELALLGQVDDYYVEHEYLESANTAFYFTEFAADAARHELAFMSEAEPTFALPEAMGEDLARRIRAAAGDDDLRTEQYLDFYAGRQFRSSLLVHAAQAPRIRRAIDGASLEGLHFFPRLPLARHDPPRLETALHVRSPFATFEADGETVTVSSALHLRALEFFERATELHPGTVTIDELLRKAVMPAEPTPADREALRDLLLELVRKQMLWFFSTPIPAQPPGDRPRVSRLVLADAAAGRSHTASLMHDKITIVNPDARRFLALLDGSRDRARLEADVLALFRAGEVTIEKPFRKLEPHEDISAELPVFVDSILSNYARLKMLE